MSLSLILCEGKTDAIIIGYLMIRVYGWKYEKKSNEIPPSIKVGKDESFEWYKRDSDFLAICGVGGKSRFSSFLKHSFVPWQNQQDKERVFSKIVIVRDRDKEEVQKIQSSLEIKGSPIQFIDNTWVDFHCFDGFKQPYILKTYLLIIPSDKEGCLESVLLCALSERPDDAKLVKCCIDFVEKNAGVAGKYLTKQRLIEKAKLGVTFAMMSPEKVFDFLDTILKEIDWENRVSLLNTFSSLKEI